MIREEEEASSLQNLTATLESDSIVTFDIPLLENDSKASQYSAQISIIESWLFWDIIFFFSFLQLIFYATVIEFFNKPNVQGILICKWSYWMHHQVGRLFDALYVEIRIMH